MYCRQWHPIPSHQLWCVTVKQSKGRIEALTSGSPHTNTIVITAGIESGFIAKRRHSSIPLQSSFLMRGTTLNGGVDGWVSRAARNGHRNPKCPSARRFIMVQEDTRAPSECATCTWMTPYEAVGYTRAFLAMW
ncbi:hypothetical protein TNCV_2380021 [Trichonephila clavipes]|nr:hypothetical protein TNCV_2380021 [Trichonephila clavipes]